MSGRPGLNISHQAWGVVCVSSRGITASYCTGLLIWSLIFLLFWPWACQSSYGFPQLGMIFEHKPVNPCIKLPQIKSVPGRSLLYVIYMIPILQKHSDFLITMC